MDYERFLSAINSGFTKDFDELYAEAFTILCSYLRTTMRACYSDAEDCAQQAIVNTVERIQSNAIREPENIYSYMLQSAKNRYLRLQFEQKRSNYQDNMEAYSPIEEQIDALVGEEEEAALKECLKKLNEASRTYIQYWLENPSTGTEEASRHFGISIHNVWVKKHRIVKKLADCIQKKVSDYL